MSGLQAKIILAMTQCGMNVTDSAARVHCHRNTVLYHFEKIRKLTGLDPRNFFDLGELYTMAREILGDEYELL